jgi:hypothetical protein
LWLQINTMAGSLVWQATIRKWGKRMNSNRFDNAMAVFKLLDKSNCRECGKSTCLAFAGAVFQGQKTLSECPRLPADILEKYGAATTSGRDRDADMAASLAALQSQIAAADLEKIAPRIGAVFGRQGLTVKCLGKEIRVAQDGSIHTDIHVHGWIAMPVLTYILQAGGTPTSGNWVPFRELAGGKTWYRLFGQQCEKPLKKIADRYTDLFEDLIQLFNGRQIQNHYQSDISLVLTPLPLVPMLICYWKPEDGLESDLHLFFDDTAEANLNIEALYTLGVGIVLMLEKLAMRHGLSPPYPAAGGRKVV